MYLDSAPMFFVRFLILLAPVIAIQLILAIALIISVARKSLPWGDKWPWLLLLLVNIIGPIIYFVVGSNKLDEKAAEYQDLQERHM